MNGINVLYMYIHTTGNSYTVLKNVVQFTFSIVIRELVYCYIVTRECTIVAWYNAFGRICLSLSNVPSFERIDL